MTKRRATDTAINQYIRLPKSVRRFTDPIVKSHATRAEKGKKKFMKALKGKK